MVELKKNALFTKKPVSVFLMLSDFKIKDTTSNLGLNSLNLVLCNFPDFEIVTI